MRRRSGGGLAGTGSPPTTCRARQVVGRRQLGVEMSGSNDDSNTGRTPWSGIVRRPQRARTDGSASRTGIEDEATISADSDSALLGQVAAHSVRSRVHGVASRPAGDDDTVASSPSMAPGRGLATDATVASEPSHSGAPARTTTAAEFFGSAVVTDEASARTVTGQGFARRGHVGSGSAGSVRSVAPSASSTPAPAVAGGPTPSVAASDLELPGYRIVRFFGQGGMGEVFLADRLSSTGVTVRCVVKTIREGVGDREQFENLFLDEARIVSHLRHPNIVSTIDVGRAGGRLYLAMEWIDGLDAGRLAKEATARGTDIPLPHVLYILRETLQALHYAHTAVGPDGEPLRIVHRDISQGNILISKHGAVKLADFGVAVGTAATTAGSAESLAGKPHYFAPELWKGARASAQTDVFALGVTFYELLSSRPLFKRGVSMSALTYEICQFDVERLIEEDLTIPDGIEEIIWRSLHQDPAQRYKSALEFLEDVNDYAYEYGIRLLDAHFGEYIARMLASEPEPEGRRRLWKE